MQIGRCGPDAVERAHLVGQFAPEFVRHVAVDPLPVRRRRRRRLLVVNVIDGFHDHFAQREGETCFVDAEMRGNRDRSIAHVGGLRGIGPDMRDLDVFDLEDRFAVLVLAPPFLVVEIVESLARDRRPVAFLTMALVEFEAVVRLLLVDRRQDIARPFRRPQAGESVLGVRRSLALDHFLHGIERVDVDARLEQALGRIRQVELRRHAQRFAGVAHHRLHDRAVILHPVEPRRVPDPGVMHRRGGARVILRLLQVDREHLVADPVERVQPSVALDDALRRDALFQRLDIAVLFQHLVELGLQRLAIGDAGVRAEDTFGESREAAGQHPRQQQRHADALLHREQFGQRRSAVDHDRGVLVGEPSGMTAGAGQADAGHFLLGARVSPRHALRVQHRAALREADRQRLLAGDNGIRNEAVTIEIGGVAEQVDGREQQPRDRRLLQRHEPFKGDAEGPRALVGMVEPAQVLLADVLIEPDGLLRLRIFRDLDMKIVPELCDVVLESRIDDTDDHDGDNNFCNRLATHGWLPVSLRRAHKFVCGQKAAGKRLSFGVL